MIAYRCVLDGGSGSVGDYTVTTVNNGIKTVMPGKLGEIMEQLSNKNVVFGNNVYIFDNACLTAFSNADFWFKGNTWRNISIKGFFNNRYNSAQVNYVKNVHFHSSLNNIFNRKSGGAGSIANAWLEWTDMSDGNGFYNAQYNIYCYNNYDGVS